jgi:hypothetical protein
MVGRVLSIVRLTGARVAYLERQELDEHGLRLEFPRLSGQGGFRRLVLILSND